MWTFHTWAVFDSSPGTLLTPSNKNFLWVPATIVDLVAVAVTREGPASNFCIVELRLSTLYAWNTLIKGDLHDWGIQELFWKESLSF